MQKLKCLELIPKSISNMEIQIIASGSSGNAYLVGDGTTSVLLDAGVPLKKIQEACQYQLRKIDGCLLSHSHGDHSKAVQKLAERGVDIYCAARTIEEIGLAAHRIKKVQPQQQFEIGSLCIMPFELVHDVVNMVASKKTGEKLVYITDTAYCRYCFSGLTHIMIEANHDKTVMRQNVVDGVIPDSLRERIVGSHMSITTALEFIKANRQATLQQIYLLHLSDENSMADDFKHSVQELSGAEVVIC